MGSLGERSAEASPLNGSPDGAVAPPNRVRLGTFDVHLNESSRDVSEQPSSESAWSWTSPKFSTVAASDWIHRGDGSQLEAVNAHRRPNRDHPTGDRSAGSCPSVGVSDDSPTPARPPPRTASRP